MSERVHQVFKELLSRGQTLSFAESCTGGLLSAEFAAVPGVSAVFMGSVVVYSNALKERLLKINANILKTSGAVSFPIARAMALNAKKELGTQWAVSVTGVAGPSGGTTEKPVGTVCFAVCGPGVEVVDRQQFSGDRSEVQEQAVHHAIRLLSQALGLQN